MGVHKTPIFMLFLWLNFLCGSTYAGNLGFGGTVKGAKLYSIEPQDWFPHYDDVFWTTANLRYQLGEGSALLDQVLFNANVGYIDRAFRTRGMSFGSELGISLGKKVNPDKVSNAVYLGVQFNYFRLAREVDGIQYTPTGYQTITLKSHGSGWSKNLVIGLDNRPSRSFGLDFAVEFLGSGDVPMKLEGRPGGVDIGNAEQSIAMHGIAFRAGFIYYFSRASEDTIWTRPLK